MTPETDDLGVRIDALESELAGSTSSRAYAPLAEAYRLAGRLQDALRTARAGVEAHPGHAGIRIVLARVLADSGEREAESAYADVLELDPDNLEAAAFIDAARAHSRASEPASEVTVAEAAESQPGTDRPPVGSLSEELAHLADLFVTPGRPSDEAEDGPFGIATLTLAEIYARQGLSDKAAEVCEAILEREPHNEEARLKLEEYRQHAAAM